ncbi:uncharacterized protein EDB91DRAFT_1248404 [Suillus paluster]|uniref:uncharacterized protein n=1 Tax=Suillus paluster TaxID=48578 RepID=UPI001B86C96D|nr:uncharacterized protein EDB91DRAFT_1248404 [Suillus paluster]KAG1740521.1 hypothetical protein EDB91DRAFT_1248404 [Suillus paluster]
MSFTNISRLVQIRQEVRECYILASKSHKANPDTSVGLHVTGVRRPLPGAIHIILSIEHPATFSEAITTRALAGVLEFDFDVVLPEACKTLQTMELLYEIWEDIFDHYPCDSVRVE